MWLAKGTLIAILVFGKLVKLGGKTQETIITKLSEVLMWIRVVKLNRFQV